MDNGFKSRKFIATLIAMLMVLIGYVLGGILPAFGTLYMTYTATMLGMLGAYLTGNVWQKRVQLKKQDSPEGEE